MAIKCWSPNLPKVLITCFTMWYGEVLLVIQSLIIQTVAVAVLLEYFVFKVVEQSS